ncbi:ABC transporter substrate-binding protein [Nocardia fusca]|uniref:ABC transporter substrate-binding protein n=1 Tax=Nocardia fusca TaxID=941183 RepID=UPI0037BC6DFB
MTHRIGILVGEATATRGGSSEWHEAWTNCATLALDDANARHALDQPVEFVVRSVEGLPTGSQHNVVQAWKELEQEGVLAILGPSNADNGMSVQETANAGKVPTIVFGCSEHLSSEWTFSVPWGPAPEDSFVAMDWARRQGYRRVAVLWDTAWHADEWMEYGRYAAMRYGLQIIGDERIPALGADEAAEQAIAEQAREGLDRLRDLNPDALVMMTSHSSGHWATALKELGWDVPRVIAGGSFGAARLLPAAFEGWVGTALWDEESNPRCADFLSRYEQRFGVRPHEDMSIAVFDGARALFEAMSLAPILTRAGLRTGLERVKFLPATAGGPDTVLSFAPYNHRGYHGAHVSILRRQANATFDGCVKDGYAELNPAGS